MKKFILFVLLLVGIVPLVRAESSATAYDSKYYSQQVFVNAYNNSSGTIALNNVVILDASQSVNPNNYLGSYVTTTATTDSVFIFGITDEAIAVGTMGRICIRGPHKAVSLTPGSAGLSGVAVSGAIVTASNQTGKFGYGSTTDGTVMGRLGYILSSTATTDTGDAANTYWLWVSPTTHK